MSGYPERFTESVLELSQLIFEEQSLEHTLDRVVGLACRTLHGCDTGSVSLPLDGLLATAASSSATASTLDSAQYRANEGPCVDAFRRLEAVVVDDAQGKEAEERWPSFVPAARREGVRSTLSLPLGIRGEPLGVLNLYAFERAAYTDDDRAVGALFAEQATVSIANARVFWQTYDLAQNLQAALEYRDVIGQAKGVLMARRGVTADTAFSLLRHHSQTTNTKLRDVAENVVLIGDLPA
jgi:GAF domain-containing protein